MAPPKPERRRSNPFREFVKPGRRRTDHPLVVGTIVLCIGVITLGTIWQVVAQFSLSRQIGIALERNQVRDVEAMKARALLIETLRGHAVVIQRVCVQTARTPDDLRQCTKGGPSH